MARSARVGDSPAAAGGEYLVNSLVRGIELLQLFTRDKPSLSLPEIAELSGLNRTTAYRFVYTLRRLGFLELEVDTRRYRLGARILQLGFEYLNSLQIVDRAYPYLRALRTEVGESTHLGILDGPSVVYVARVPGEHIVSTSVNVGSRLPAHLTAMGRVLLAYLPADRLDAILDTIDFQPRTPHSVANASELQKKLDQVREQGYALTDQEYEAGVSSAAAPIRGPEGDVIAAINLSAPAMRITRDTIRRSLLPALLRTADELSMAMGHRGQARTNGSVSPRGRRGRS
jgi:IclR family transcriptional regulator, pca regulon regulatory protein